jgi:uncharacterized protein (DUF433 family)
MKIFQKENLIEVDPEKLSGTPVFAGTRVPIANLFDHLEGGENINEFLEGFPPVTYAQAMEVIRLARQSLLREILED